MSTTELDPTTASGIELTDRWAPDEHDVWRCGDLVITLDANEPRRYLVRTRDGDNIFRGLVPLAGWHEDDFAWFASTLASDSLSATNGALAVPADGLEEWFERAAAIAAEAMIADAALADQMRAEYELHRVGRTAARLLEEVPAATDWLVPGVLVRGWAIKIAGREKVGKGKWVYYLLARLERNELTVFGPALGRPVTSLILTEEPIESIREKVTDSGLRDALIIYGWELAKETWEEKVVKIVAAAIEGGHQVVFVDNVSRSARISSDDENGTGLARAVELLQDACRKAGLALIIDHHHKKGGGAIEDKSRGGTALPGATEVNIEMERVGGRDSRVRRLTSSGRMSATVWQRCVELSEDGTDYVTVADERSSDGAAADREDRLFGDLTLLREHAPVTSKDFASLIDVTDRTARRRLMALVKAGHAHVEPGEMTAKGQSAAVFTLGPEPADTDTPIGHDTMSAGSSGSQNPACLKA